MILPWFALRESDLFFSKKPLLTLSKIISHNGVSKSMISNDGVHAKYSITNCCVRPNSFSKLNIVHRRKMENVRNVRQRIQLQCSLCMRSDRPACKRVPGLWCSRVGQREFLPGSRPFGCQDCLYCHSYAKSMLSCTHIFFNILILRKIKAHK